MKKIATRFLAVAMALMTVVTMSEAFTVTAEAASKNVEVNYNQKNVKKASVKSLSVSVDGNKAGKKATVYLTGNKKVKLNTVTTVNVNGKKLKNANKVTYKSSDTKVASVNSKGVITAKKAGKATITVTSKANKKKTYKVKLTVKKGIKSMKLDKSSLSLTEGESADVKATVTVDKKAKAKTTITAKSSDSNVASVTVKGDTVSIKAVAAGEADVTVTPKFGSGKAKTVKVTVAKKAPVYKYTRVDFTNPKANEITLKGTLTFDNTKDSDLAEDIKTVLKAIGGDYEITIGQRKLTVKNGETTQDLSKMVKSGERTDVTVKCTKNISELLTMMSSAKLTKDVAYTGTLKVAGLGDLTNIKLTKDGKASVTIGKDSYVAFAAKGNLYLEGDQSKLAAAFAIIKDNNSVIKGFTPVENY